jgi:nucleotide-binding universal stress UspA family protein
VFNTILVGLDGSKGSGTAIPVAADIARRYGARLVLGHIEERVPGKGGVVPMKDEGLVRADLEERARELSGQGIDTTIEARSTVLGGPAHALEELADGVDADLIVVGRHGHSPTVGLLVGSVTQRLLHISRRPVLATPTEKRSGS